MWSSPIRWTTGRQVWFAGCWQRPSNRSDFGPRSFLQSDSPIIEVGPRLSFNTAWCTNAVSIFHNCGIRQGPAYRAFPSLSPHRARCRRPGDPEAVHGPGPRPDDGVSLPRAARVVRQRRSTRTDRRDSGARTRAAPPWRRSTVKPAWPSTTGTSITTRGCSGRYCGRNPTNVECFDIAQSNSEHSRHWFFKGTAGHRRTGEARAT